jgi:hypothetical protein
VWYPSPSGTSPGVVALVHTGSTVAWSHAFIRPATAERANPSIAPPLMSRSAAVTLCGPPPSINEVSWYGRTQPATPGTGTQTVATPLRIGIPSAPGKVPK